jgi:hypothetical protein
MFTSLSPLNANPIVSARDPAPALYGITTAYDCLICLAQGWRNFLLLAAKRLGHFRRVNDSSNFKYIYLPHFASHTLAFKFDNSLALPGHLSDVFSCLILLFF